jgi:hypothetical protein
VNVNVVISVLSTIWLAGLAWAYIESRSTDRSLDKKLFGIALVVIGVAWLFMTP